MAETVADADGHHPPECCVIPSPKPVGANTGIDWSARPLVPPLVHAPEMGGLQSLEKAMTLALAAAHDPEWLVIFPPLRQACLEEGNP